MNLLFNIDLKNYKSDWEVFSRPSARGIIFNEDKKIALVHSKKYDYYKFPGGGIKNNEDSKSALIREVLEETGLCVIPDSIKDFGYVRRIQKSNVKEETIFLQDSFYFECKVEKSINTQNLDDYEAEAEFELQFVDLKAAIQANKRFDDEDSFNVVMIARDTIVMEMLLGVESNPSLNSIYDDYDKLIQVLDSTCGADGTLNLEKRMSDVKKRYGKYPQAKWDKNFELKAYFEEKMGKEYYSVLNSPINS